MWRVVGYFVVFLGLLFIVDISPLDFEDVLHFLLSSLIVACYIVLMFLIMLLLFCKPTD